LLQSLKTEPEVACVEARKSYRIQDNLLAERERDVLNWICARLPSVVTPDHLTATGLVGALIICAGYLASRHHPAFLWVATVGLVVNWFGDSLDGSLARHRRIERPRYGYFLDHSVDALGGLLIMVGLGGTAYVRMDTALFVLVGYYMLCIFVFLNRQVTGKVQLSFLALGPTELRIGLIAVNVWMYARGQTAVTIGGQTLSGYDVALCLTGASFVGLFVANTLKLTRQLKREEAGVETVPNQRALDVVDAPVGEFG
jgi:phosphatidylglycerophosphate synthase